MSSPTPDHWQAAATDGKSRRPSERQLVAELATVRHSLLDGFDSRRKVLTWAQQVVVRTLGQIPQRRYEQLAKSFKPDTDYLEGPLLAGFLNADARTRDMDDDVAQGLRERWAADVLGSVQDQAFRRLRQNAGEYVGETEADENGDDPGYDPAEQSFAMRPALSELNDLQRDALTMLVGTDTQPSGLADRTAILDWGGVLTAATRGEPVAPDYGAGGFIPKAYREPSTVDLLTDDSAAYCRAREAFAAHWLLPAFNRAVRDLEGRTGEEPAQTQTDDRGPTDG